MPFDTAAWTRTLLQMAPDAKRVQVGVQRTWGLLDDREQLVDDGTGNPVPLATRLVHIAAGSLTGITDGTTITVGGVTYTVRGRPMPQENGELVSIMVTKVRT